MAEVQSTAVACYLGMGPGDTGDSFSECLGS